MSRISRYVLRETLAPTGLGMLVYGMVLLMNLALEAAEQLIRRDLPISLVALYLLLALPRILVLIIPMGLLLGVLVGIGRLASDGEITALRASGYPDYKLVYPIMALGLLGTVCSGLLFNVAVPAANYAQHRLNARIFLSSDISREITPRVFYERIPNLLIYADESEPSDGSLRRVLIYQRAEDGQEELSSAATVQLHQQPSRGGLQFRLEDVTSHAWQPSQAGLYQVTRAESQSIDRPPDLFVQEMMRLLITPPPRNLREQTLPHLIETLQELRGKEVQVRGIRRQIRETLIEAHKKISLPATCLSFCIVALPLALGRRRRSGARSWSFAISLAVIVLSYVLLTAGEQMAGRGRVPAWSAMWAGNILFTGAGLIMLAGGSRLDLSFGAMHPMRLFARFRRRNATTAASPQAAPLAAKGSPPRPPQRRFPSTLDRYLLRHLAYSTMFITLSLSVVVTLFHAIPLLEDLSDGRKPAAPLLPYLLYLQPQILFAYVAPVALCVGTLVTFAMLSRSHELTAIRAGGVGAWRVAVPFVLASLVTAAASFVAHDALLPHANQEANLLRDQIRNRSPRSYRRPDRRWVFGSSGLLFNFSHFNPDRNEFQDLSIFRFRPGTFDIDQRTFAFHASWVDGAWMLDEGWTRTFSGDEEAYETFKGRSAPDIDPPAYFVQDWKAPDQMDFRELRLHVADLDQRGYDTRELRVGLHRKISVPCVAVVMLLMALPFCLRVERRGPGFALGSSVLLVFVYYAVMQAFGKMGEIAVLPPLMAAWGPNLIFAGAGVYSTISSRW